MNSDFAKSLKLLILFALLVRILVCVGYILTSPNEITPLIGDYQTAGTDGHIQIARTFYLSGRYAYLLDGHLVHNRPPIHPFFLLIFGAWSTQYWYVFWFAFTIALCVPGILLTNQTLKNLKIKPKYRLWACAVYTFHPWLVLSCRTTTFVPETIILLQLLAYFYFHPQIQPYKAQGIAAVLALTHGSFIFLPFLVTYGYFTRKISIKIPFIMACAIISLWTLRNYVAFHQFIPVVTGGGIQYWKGEESVFTDKKDIYIDVFQKHTGKPPEVKFFGTIKPEDDKVYTQLAINHIQNHFPHFLYRTLHGYWYFWAPHENFLLKAYMSGIPNFIFLCLLGYSIFTKKLYPETWAFLVFIGILNTIFAILVPHASYFPMVLGVFNTILFYQCFRE